MPAAHLRFPFLLAFIACASILGAAFHLQQTFALEPCVLCWLQRLLLLLCALMCLGITLSPDMLARRWYGPLFALTALAGGVAAGVQVWLQTASMDALVPPLATLEHLLDTLGLVAQIDSLRAKMLLCAEVNWSLFGFSLPEGSLLVFCALGLFALWALYRGLRGFSSGED